MEGKEKRKREEGRKQASKKGKGRKKGRKIEKEVGGRKEGRKERLLVFNAQSTMTAVSVQRARKKERMIGRRMIGHPASEILLPFHCLNPDSKLTCLRQLSASRISAVFSPRLPPLHLPPPPPIPHTNPPHECAS